ncbi:hypothetical protein ID866_4746 [Astraeus odoratus]|nr:hypothetical protein ID866_4746 [Astraeus odoratus]
MAIRNIILCGDVGVGKSSIINSIAGREVARTSNDAPGSTPRTMCYTLTFDPSTRIRLWETPGLGEGEGGTIGHEQASKVLKDLLEILHVSDRVDLLLLCMPGGRTIKRRHENYKAICENVRGKLPVALVITNLERENDMHQWWMRNGKKLEQQGLVFDAHACVTTLSDGSNDRHINDSHNRLRRLVLHHISVVSPKDARRYRNTVRRSNAAPRLTYLIPVFIDSFISIIGPIGSGKSSFVSRVTGLSEAYAGVGHGLNPSTSIGAFTYTDEGTGKSVVLLDVPGFGHPSLSNSTIVTTIMKWLGETYKGRIPLGGILYLHPITNPDMAILPREILNSFNPLGRKCGGSIMSKLSFVTTMWDTVSRLDGEATLVELQRVWRPMLGLGKTILCYENTHESAREVVQGCFPS